MGHADAGAAKEISRAALRHAGTRAEFDYSGTRDNSNWLAVPAALDYFDGLGPQAIYVHNTALAEAAGALRSLL